MRLRDLIDELWIFALRDALKPLFVLIASALHLAFLFAAALVLRGVRDFGRLETAVRVWEPVKPEIFDIEAREP